MCLPRMIVPRDFNYRSGFKHRFSSLSTYLMASTRQVKNNNDVSISVGLRWVSLWSAARNASGWAVCVDPNKPTGFSEIS
jgi:hypothetical protein